MRSGGGVRPGVSGLAALLALGSALAIGLGLGARFPDPLQSMVGAMIVAYLAQSRGGAWLLGLGSILVAAPLLVGRDAPQLATLLLALGSGLAVARAAQGSTGRARCGAGLYWAAAIVLNGVTAATAGLAKGGLLRYPGSDKALHLALYGLVAFFLVPRFWGRRPGLALLAWALFASLDELGQGWLPHRTSDLGDWLASMLGIVAGGALGVLVFSPSASRIRLPIEGARPDEAQPLSRPPQPGLALGVQAEDAHLAIVHPDTVAARGVHQHDLPVILEEQGVDSRERLRVLLGAHVAARVAPHQDAPLERGRPDVAGDGQPPTSQREATPDRLLVLEQWPGGGQGPKP